MNRKGQEEIAGFVIIVVLVTIIGLIFLVLTLSDDSEMKEGKDERRLLESTMEFTSECAYYLPNYRTVKDLLKECHFEPDKKCLNGKSTCQILNESLKGIMDNAYPIGDEYQRKGFLFNAYYSLNTSDESDKKGIISLSKGNCSTNSFMGADYSFSVSPGSITSAVRICY